jgi:hypothetical protein
MGEKKDEKTSEKKVNDRYRLFQKENGTVKEVSQKSHAGKVGIWIDKNQRDESSREEDDERGKG